MLFGRFSAGLVALLVMAGCTPKQKEVTGRVFIVTAGGETKNLGLVPISIFQNKDVYAVKEKVEAALLPELSSLQSKSKAYGEESQKARQAVDTLTKEIEDLESEAISSERRRPDRSRKYNTSVFVSSLSIENSEDPVLKNKVVEGDPDEVYKIMATKWRKEDDAIQEALENKRREAPPLLANWKEANQRYLDVLLRLSFFNEEFQEEVFKILSNPIASTKTDGDGHFVLTIPPEGEFVVAASTSRRILEKTEKYFWLFKLPKNFSKDRPLNLNNDNLLTSNYPDSIVFLPIPTN